MIAVTDRSFDAMLTFLSTWLEPNQAFTPDASRAVVPGESPVAPATPSGLEAVPSRPVPTVTRSPWWPGRCFPTALRLQLRKRYGNRALTWMSPGITITERLVYFKLMSPKRNRVNRATAEHIRKNNVTGAVSDYTFFI
jgi:hypothetical protein